MTSSTTSKGEWPREHFTQAGAHFFVCEGLSGKYFQLCGPHAFSDAYSSLFYDYKNVRTILSLLDGQKQTKN
jgi:hypothetical protein